MAKAGSVRDRVLAALFLTALAALCLAARTVPALDAVLPEGSPTRLLGADAHFHLRHTTYAAGNGLRLLRRDCGSGFPRGPSNDAAGLWDLGLAALARVRFGPAPTLDEVARTMAWVPPLLAAMALLLLYRACRCCLARPASLVACALFVLYPGESLERTLLGFADHHAAELLLALALILGLLLQTRRADEPVGWARSLLHSMPIAALTFTWRGAPVYVAAAFSAVAVLALLEWRRKPGARGLAMALWRYGAAATLSTVAAALLFPSWILERRSLLIVVGGAAALALAGLLASAALRESPRRAASGLALFGGTLALGIAAVLLAPALGELTANTLRTRSSLVSEHAPLTVARWMHLTGAPGLLAAPGLLVAAWEALRHRLSPSAVLLAVYGVLLAALWVVTRDFGYVTAPFLAANAALALDALARRLASWLPHRSFRRPGPSAARTTTGWEPTHATRALALGPLFILAIAPAWPLGITRSPVATQATISTLSIYSPAWLEAMSWLEEHSPSPARSPRSCAARSAATGSFPDYGVMAPWMYGDALATYADRVPRWSRQPSARIAAWGLATSEAAATDALCPECEPGERLLYAVLGASTCGHRFLSEAAIGGHAFEAVADGRLDLDGSSVSRLSLGPGYRDSMFFRLCSDRGDGLSTYRLIYESSEGALTLSRLRSSDRSDPASRPVLDLLTTDPARNPALARRLLAGRPVRTPLGILYDARLDAEVSIYEVVRGATLVGRAPPGSSVVAQLELGDPGSGGGWTYQVASRTTEDGLYSLTVAYPTAAEPERSSVRAESSYTLRAPGPDGPVMATVEVSPQQVREGAVLRAPELIRPEYGKPELEEPEQAETADPSGGP